MQQVGWVLRLPGSSKTSWWSTYDMALTWKGDYRCPDPEPPIKPEGGEIKTRHGVARHLCPTDDTPVELVKVRRNEWPDVKMSIGERVLGVWKVMA